jgi:hypothetical protein
MEPTQIELVETIEVSHVIESTVAVQNAVEYPVNQGAVDRMVCAVLQAIRFNGGLQDYLEFEVNTRGMNTCIYAQDHNAVMGILRFRFGSYTIRSSFRKVTEDGKPNIYYRISFRKIPVEKPD